MTVDFDAPYDDPDPWGYRSSWYEERRRRLMLACLPRERFSAALEIGCANGEFTARLAERADRVRAIDRSQRALELARQRVPQPHVSFDWARQPDQWPAGPFDLVLMADVGYYMDSEELAACCAGIREVLAGDGCVLAAHWRHPFAAARQSQAAVHATLHEGLRLHGLAEYEDRDLRINVWTRQPQSVAEREGRA